MARAKTVRKTELALKPIEAEPEVKSVIQPIQDSLFDVPGTHLCVPVPLTPEQLKDSCEEQIRDLAYQKWEAAGCPSGDGFDFWLEAEHEVLSTRT